MNRLQKYRRTVKGVAQTMYDTQKRNCKHRGHNMPEYTRDELLEWLLSQPNFQELFENWVNSGYDKWLKPSIDRLDDYKGYSFDNIRLTTWKKNNSRSHSDMKNCINTKKSKSVILCDLDGNELLEFKSVASAARWVNGSRWNITSICNGIGNTYLGWKWKFKDYPPNSL